jgi:hypothetical protein
MDRNHKTGIPVEDTQFQKIFFKKREGRIQKDISDQIGPSAGT